MVYVHLSMSHVIGLPTIPHKVSQTFFRLEQRLGKPIHVGDLERRQLVAAITHGSATFPKSCHILYIKKAQWCIQTIWCRLLHISASIWTADSCQARAFAKQIRLASQIWLPVRPAGPVFHQVNFRVSAIKFKVSPAWPKGISLLQTSLENPQMQGSVVWCWGKIAKFSLPFIRSRGWCPHTAVIKSVWFVNKFGSQSTDQKNPKILTAWNGSTIF